MKNEKTQLNSSLKELKVAQVSWHTLLSGCSILILFVSVNCLKLKEYPLFNNQSLSVTLLSINNPVKKRTPL